MEARSCSKINKFTTYGNTILVHFDEVEIIDESGSVCYQYTVAKLGMLDDRDTRIESIIAIKYPTYGAELAALHKQDPEYLEFRLLAKEMSDESIMYQESLEYSLRVTELSS